MTAVYLLVAEGDLNVGATKVPARVVRTGYLHRKMGTVKLHVTKGRKDSEG
jgi:hypothetical protein